MYAPESKASVCLNVFHVISLRTFKHFFSLQSPFLKFQKLFFIHNCPFTLSILSLRVAFHISSNLDSYVQSLCSAAPQEWDWCPSSLLSATPGTEEGPTDISCPNELVSQLIGEGDLAIPEPCQTACLKCLRGWLVCLWKLRMNKWMNKWMEVRKLGPETENGSYDTSPSLLLIIKMKDFCQGFYLSPSSITVFSPSEEF